MTTLPLSLSLALLSLLPQTPPQEKPPPPIPADTQIQTTASGLKYSVLAEGKGGRKPGRGDKVKVHYTGWFPDGRVFDSSREREVPFDWVAGTGQVIAGWDEAVTMMTPGTRLKLTVPPELAWAKRGMAPKIPPDATVIFDIELLDVTFVAPEFHQPRGDATKELPSKLRYEVLHEGTGAAFDPAKPFEMKYGLWTTQGKLLDASELGRPLKGRMDQLRVPPFAFAKEIFPLLKVGSRIRVEVPPELGFGAQTPDPSLPPNSPTVWEFELVRQIDTLPLPPFAMTPEGRGVKTKSGLVYEVLREGTGPSPKPGQNVTLNYAGWTTDGKPFDSSYQNGEPSAFRVAKTAVIQGWVEGLQLMKEGGMYRFTIPPELAYGKRGQAPLIGPDQTLVFVIELIKVGL